MSLAVSEVGVRESERREGKERKEAGSKEGRKEDFESCSLWLSPSLTLACQVHIARCWDLDERGREARANVSVCGQEVEREREDE